jgi:hypothetical protein
MVKLKLREPRHAFLLLLMGAMATIPAIAGSMAIGSVAFSTDASLSGQGLLPKTTIFSGDSLQVRNGIAEIAVGSNNRMIFGRDTLASFLRISNEVTVLLNQGNVSLFHAADGTPLRVKAGEILIDPAAGSKAAGDIAVLSGSVVITAKEGALQVNDHGTARNVAKGETVVIALNAAKGGAASTSAIGGAVGGSAIGVGTAAAGTAGLATAATAADKFIRPAPSRPTGPGNGSNGGANPSGPTLTSAAGAAAAAAGQGAGCAPPSPSKPPAASTVIPFTATPGPVCPEWGPQ